MWSHDRLRPVLVSSMFMDDLAEMYCAIVGALKNHTLTLVNVFKLVCLGGRCPFAFSFNNDCRIASVRLTSVLIHCASCLQTWCGELDSNFDGFKFSLVLLHILRVEVNYGSETPPFGPCGSIWQRSSQTDRILHPCQMFR